MVEASEGRVRAIKRATGQTVMDEPPPVTKTDIKPDTFDWDGKKWYPGIENDKKKEAIRQERIRQQERESSEPRDVRVPIIVADPNNTRVIEYNYKTREEPSVMSYIAYRPLLKRRQ